MRRLTVSLLLAFAVTSLAACGQDDASPPSGQSGAESPEIGHVHGLGINPADGALFIATHNGLLRAGAGSPRATPVGASRQDVMGFSVLGSNRFLGSGHPGPGQNLPPLLGLIESDTAGQSWRAISLLGQADFHVLRSARPRVYGSDSTTGALMVSGDAGRSWATRQPPGPLLDLAIDPTDPDEVVVSAEEGLFSSRNAGQTWRPLQPGAVGLLSWPAPGKLLMIDVEGTARVSGDAGRSWRDAGGTIGRQPAAFTSHGTDLYAALSDGTVKRSVDGGQTWRVRATAG